ncbi:alcohol dehydrogenase catalytic domain-containing protein [Nocardioides dilutus]
MADRLRGRALRWHAAGDIRLDPHEPRQPEADEVLLAVAWCGICGSDLHEVADGPHAIPVDQAHGLSHARAPITLGHEFSGEVLAVGSRVAHVRPGERVAVEPNYRCGQCVSCGEGRYEVCDHLGFAGLMGDGGMADYAVVPAYMVHSLPPDFGLASAAVLEPAAVALHSVRQSGFRPGQVVLVIGLGPVGLLVGGLLKLRGAGVVLGVDPIPSRRRKAEDMGMDLTLDPSEDVPAACREATGGNGVHVAFEVVGKQESLTTGLRSLRSGGELMLLGLMPTAEIPVFEMVNAELRISTSVGYRDCHRELIDLVSAGRLDLASLVTHRIELGQASDTLSSLAVHGSDEVKTLVHCHPDVSA